MTNEYPRNLSCRDSGQFYHTQLNNVNRVRRRKGFPELKVRVADAQPQVYRIEPAI